MMLLKQGGRLLSLGVSAGNWLPQVLAALCTLVLEWYLCYWLYKRGIFFKM